MSLAVTITQIADFYWFKLLNELADFSSCRKGLLLLFTIRMVLPLHYSLNQHACFRFVMDSVCLFIGTRGSIF